MIATFLLAAALSQKPDLAAIAAGANGKVGAAALVVETGETLSLNASQRFPMQSVYKTPISMAVLREVDRGKHKLTETIRVHKRDLVPGLHSPMRDEHPNGEFDITLRELIRYAIKESDGSASDILLQLAGGPSAVTAFLRSIGVDAINVATSERAMTKGDDVQYRNWATPNGAIQLLRALHEGKGLSKASRDVVLDDMIASTPGPNRIKGQLPAGTVVAHKTGTSGTHNGVTAATNDIGIVTLPDGRHLLIAVLVSDSRADLPLREGTIAKIARASYDFAVRR